MVAMSLEPTFVPSLSTISSASLLSAPVAAALMTRGGGGMSRPVLGNLQRRRSTTLNNKRSSNEVLKKKHTWFDLPEPFRFFVSGNLGTLCFFGLERLVHSSLCNLQTPPSFVATHMDTLSFFFAYVLQMISQHLLHAWIVYGLETINTREKYFRTLLGQVGAYGVAMVGSTILNTLLRGQGLSKDIAFFSTMFLFAIINYFVIGWVVRRAVSAAEERTAPTNKTISKRTKIGLQVLRGGAFGALSAREDRKVSFLRDTSIEIRKMTPMNDKKYL